MKNFENKVKGFMVLSFLALALVAGSASADNDNKGKNSDLFLNARAELKADALVKMESASGVVLGPNGAVRVLGAKVVSADDDLVKANLSLGNTVLSFNIDVDAATKVNGKKSSASVEDLEAGDIISFSGKMTSSTSSTITVDGEHIVSRALLSDAKAKLYSGEISAINSGDNSLTLKYGGKTVTVKLNSSTQVVVDGEVKNLSALDVGDEVKISGEINSDGSVITASKIISRDDDSDDDEDESKEERKENKENRGWWLGKLRNLLWR